MPARRNDALTEVIKREEAAAAPVIEAGGPRGVMNRTRRLRKEGPA